MQRLKGASCAVSQRLVRLPKRSELNNSASLHGKANDEAEFRSDYRFKRTRWSDDEDAILRELASAHLTSREIAIRLRRTLASVHNRARVIGVQLAHASQVGACRRHRCIPPRSSRTGTGIASRHADFHQHIDAGVPHTERPLNVCRPEASSRHMEPRMIVPGGRG